VPGLIDTASRFVDSALDRTVAPGYSRIGLAVRRRLPGWPPDPEPGALVGQHVVVTGASSGLGRATAKGLAALGATVHLVVRDVPKGDRVAAELTREVPGAELLVHRCDVGDLDDVRRFVDQLDTPAVSALVHNAGAMPEQRTESPQGHELTMSLHVLAPVLMTELLLPRLTLRSRVVMVSSGGMYGQQLRADDPEYLDGEYSGVTAYARSKRAQVELLPVLDARWRSRGADVHGMHPGWADTPGIAESLPRFHALTGPFLRSADEGADTTVWLCSTQPAPEAGRFWHDRRPRHTQLMPGRRTPPADIASLWEWVAASTGLDAG
jgi:NAD(P)-dependent dehydrogenase (short-subunit alcohol dehydrogenase family)